MKYQDFSSNENFLFSEDTIVIFNSEYVNVVMTTSASANRKLSSQHRACQSLLFTNHSPWKKHDGIFKSTNFDINIFDDEPNEGIE